MDFRDRGSSSVYVIKSTIFMSASVNNIFLIPGQSEITPWVCLGVATPLPIT